MSSEPLPGFTRRTREQGLQTILNYAKKNRFEKGRFRSLDGKRRDVIGCLLTTRQLDWCRQNNLMDAEVHFLAQRVGEKNLKFMTGMGVKELSDLQMMNDSDNARAKLVAYCRRELAKHLDGV